MKLLLLGEDQIEELNMQVRNVWNEGVQQQNSSYVFRELFSVIVCFIGSKVELIVFAHLRFDDHRVESVDHLSQRSKIESSHAIVIADQVNKQLSVSDEGVSHEFQRLPQSGGAEHVLEARVLGQTAADEQEDRLGSRAHRSDVEGKHLQQLLLGVLPSLRKVLD